MNQRCPIITLNITSSVAGLASRPVRVYTPPGYRGDGTVYPVLYMHDGQNVFAPGGPFGCWRAEEVLDAEIGAGCVAPLIVVAIDNDGLNRRAEYVPPGDTYTGAEPGKADAYAAFLVKDVMPVIEARFPVTGEAALSGVAGSSLGGVVSLYLALESGRFGRVGSMSTAICWAQNYVASRRGKTPVDLRVYHDIGAHEVRSMAPANYRERNLELQDALTAWLVDPGRRLRFEIDPHGDHHEASWYARLPAMLRWLFPPSPPTA